MRYRCSLLDYLDRLFNLFKRFNIVIHRPQQLRNTPLLLKRWEVELELREMFPVGSGRERTGRGLDGILEEPLGEADERQEFRQKAVARGRKQVDVARDNSIESGHGNFALVCPALTKEHLPRPAAAGEGGAVRHVAPRADM